MIGKIAKNRPAKMGDFLVIGGDRDTWVGLNVGWWKILQMNSTPISVSPYIEKSLRNRFQKQIVKYASFEFDKLSL